MPRYKTVGFSKCANGHMQAIDERRIADSPEKAQPLSIAAVDKRLCSICGSSTAAINIIGTEEIQLHPQYIIYGYTCQCGETVEVYRTEIDVGFTPPASTTVACSRGHSRTVLNPEFPSLKKWMGKAN